MCIRFSDETINELRSGMINFIPKFYGKIRQNSHEHLANAMAICTFKSDSMKKDALCSRAFQFTLEGRSAKI